MYRSALRTAPRATGAIRQNALRTTVPRRFASTAPADKKRSWKSSAVRWGLAAGAVYYYSTSPVFAEEIQPLHVQPPPQFSDDDLPTVEAVIAEKRKEAEARAARAAEEAAKDKVAAPVADKQVSASEPEAGAPESGEVSGPEALEAEANQQGAFNPETGEINWDCPCLGGMAHGPCGEEFKAAFSCFVYSKEEPKGMDCIDKFQHMQDCFRLHPEVYGDELADDDEEAQAPAAEATPEAASAAATTPVPELDATTTSPTSAVVDVKTDVKAPTSDEQPSADKSESKAPASKSS
ncbi:Oxidoreductase [Neopestalotiopsis sp. 37M]|nr:Oxidoreductase [Neopestalotiopsis sp. 37M]